MPSSISQTDPKASYFAHKKEIDASIKEVLESGRYILGKQVAAFENEFAGYLGVPHVVGVGSGTDAIHLALKTCGIGLGDIVITVSHTAVATIAAIELAGAMPVVVDIDPGAYTMAPEALKHAIHSIQTGKMRGPQGTLKAIIPVHLYGHPADMPAIMKIARHHELFVIEDCAQSHGAAIEGHKTGAWGDLSAFSFYPTKNLGALGDGGALGIRSSILAEKARSLREYGWHERYISLFSGMNTRLDEIQASVLRVKLRHLDEDNDHRRQLADLYLQRLVSTPIDLPPTSKGSEHAYHQFVIRSKHRDTLQSYLKARGIGTNIHYPVPVHLQPAYRGRLIVDNVLPETERAAREVLSLPLYPELQKESVHAVIETILEFAETEKV